MPLACAFASDPQPPPRPFKNTGQKLLHNNTAFRSKMEELIGTAPAGSHRSFQQSSLGFVVPDHPRFVSRQVHVQPCCRLTPVRAFQTTSPATSATISSRICGTGTHHDLLNDSFRQPLLPNHFDHVNDLSTDLRQRNSENCQVHQAHLSNTTKTNSQVRVCVSRMSKFHSGCFSRGW